MERNSTLSDSPIFRKNFKFHSILEVRHSILCKLSKFYKEIFIIWGKYLSSPATLLSTVTCILFYVKVMTAEVPTERFYFTESRALIHWAYGIKNIFFVKK